MTGIPQQCGPGLTCWKTRRGRGLQNFSGVLLRANGVRVVMPAVVSHSFPAEVTRYFAVLGGVLCSAERSSYSRTIALKQL